MIGLVAQLALLAALAATVGLTRLAGWVVGVAVGVDHRRTLARGLARRGADALGPADRVTLARAMLVGGVAALIADSFAGPTPVAALVALAAVALVARRGRRPGRPAHRHVSALGARFDMEVDAFLILVLSVYVARSVGVVGAGDRRGALRCSSRPAGCCRGCARRCRRATGARSSRRSRASC